MKNQRLKLCLVAAMAIFVGKSYAQPRWIASNGISPDDLITNSNVLNVGINVSPASTLPYNLTVNGNIGFYPSTTIRSILGEADGNYLGIYGYKNISTGAALHLYAGNSTTNPGMIDYIAYNNGGSTSLTHNFSKYNGSTSTSILTMDNQGNVRVGNATPTTDRFTIDGTLAINADDPSNDWFRNIKAHADAGGLNISANNYWADGPMVRMFGKTNTESSGTKAGSMEFISYASSTADNAFNFFSWDGSNWKQLFKINKDGKVAVGNAAYHLSPSGYKLFVEEGILTEKLVVNTMGGNAVWPDYVFANDYKLKPLSEIETYVKTNKHLPEIPSAAEINKDGINVGDMNAKLLKKVEELTLYVIDQQKQINTLQEKLNK